MAKCTPHAPREEKSRASQPHAEREECVHPAALLGLRGSIAKPTGKERLERSDDSLGIRADSLDIDPFALSGGQHEQLEHVGCLDPLSPLVNATREFPRRTASAMATAARAWRPSGFVTTMLRVTFDSGMIAITTRTDCCRLRPEVFGYPPRSWPA